jgi:hypothetical protein
MPNGVADGELGLRIIAGLEVSRQNMTSGNDNLTGLPWAKACGIEAGRGQWTHGLAVDRRENANCDICINLPTQQASALGRGAPILSRERCLFRQGYRLRLGAPVQGRNARIRRDAVKRVEQLGKDRTAPGVDLSQLREDKIPDVAEGDQPFEERWRGTDPIDALGLNLVEQPAWT